MCEDGRPWRRFADELLYLPGVYANALLETAEEVGASITSSDLWQPGGCLLNLDAVFRRGVVSLSGVNSREVLGILSCNQRDLDLRLDTGLAGGAQDYSITFKRSIDAFMDAYLQCKRPPTNGEDGLFTMRMEQAVVDSAKTGRTVRLE
jgi:predicted dehydrogenase